MLYLSNRVPTALTEIIHLCVISADKKALSQLPIVNQEGWSLDERQTVGGRDAAIEPQGWVHGVSALDQTPAQHQTGTEP